MHPFMTYVLHGALTGLLVQSKSRSTTIKIVFWKSNTTNITLVSIESRENIGLRLWNQALYFKIPSWAPFCGYSRERLGRIALSLIFDYVGFLSLHRLSVLYFMLIFHALSPIS